MIKVECGQFIKELEIDKYPTRAMYHGTRSPSFGTKMRMPIDRTPRDLPLQIHNAANEMFKRRFGVPFRSVSVFASGHTVSTEQYGASYKFFPLDGYKYCWSPIYDDMYDAALDAFPNVVVKKDLDPDLVVDFLRKGDYRDHGLYNAWVTGHEIMFSGPGYYLLER